MRNLIHLMVRVIVLSTVAVVPAAVQRDKSGMEIKRDASGRVVISNVAPATVPQPQPQTALPLPSDTAAAALSIPSPAMEAISSGFLEWPFSNSDGGASVVHIGGSLPNEIALAKAADGKPIVIKSKKAEVGTSGFPYHAKLFYRAMPHLTNVGEWRLDNNPPARPTLEAIEPAKEWVNYYLGNNREMWQTRLPVHHGMRLRGIAHGIDLEYTVTETLHRYHMTVEPRFDLTRLFLSFSQEASIDVNGSLITQENFGNSKLRNPAPRAWHEIGGSEVPVAVRWTRASFGMGAPTLAFEGNDPQQPLHVAFDLYRWIAGPSQSDQKYGPVFSMNGAVAVDEEQNIYVVGASETKAARLLFDFLIPDGSTHESGRRDLMVQKFKPSGELVYSTFIGGAHEDGEALALSLDREGNLFVAASSWVTHLPLTVSTPCERDCAGIFVAKLGRDGELLDSRAVAGIEGAKQMVLDAQGILYVAGDGKTPLLDAATKNGLQAGDYWGYVAKIDVKKSADSAVVWATKLGWLSQVSALAFDAGGSVYAGGAAFPPQGSAAVLPNPGYRSRVLGMGDALIVKLDPTKSGADILAASTFIGGSGGVFEFEFVEAIGLDDAGNVYAAGSTTESQFPTTDGAWSRSARGGTEGFLCKFDPSLKELRWSTFIGGSGKDAITALRVDRGRNVYVAGTTSSQNFPLILSPSSDHANESEPDNDDVNHIFAAKVSSTGSHLVWSTFLSGGQMAEHATGNFLAVNRSGGVVVVGDSTVRYERPQPIKAWANSNYRLGFLTVGPCGTCPEGPSITEVSRGFGSGANITGRGFNATVKVLVDGVPAVITSHDATKLKLTLPSLPGSERGEITVLNPDGQSASASLPPSALSTPGSTGRKHLWTMAGIGFVLVVMIAAFARRRRSAILK